MVRQAAGISAPTLERNKVAIKAGVYFPQAKDKRRAMAFPYMRDGEVVNVKYRGRGDDGGKIFVQEKGAERIFHGLDDLVAGDDDIIIVEGEMDKLALNEAGYWNVLSFPDGAPETPIGGDGLIDPEKDSPKFECVWNCREYLDRAKRVNSRRRRRQGRQSSDSRARPPHRSR